MTTPASAITKRTVGFLLGMSTLMLGANLVWVSYNSVLLPTLVEKVVTQSKGLVVGLIGLFGTLLALLVSILWGIISDHTSSKLGKRIPIIIFLAGGIVFLTKVSQKTLDGRLQASVEEAGGLA